jgi:hypothetical protein
MDTSNRRHDKKCAKNKLPHTTPHIYFFADVVETTVSPAKTHKASR